MDVGRRRLRCIGHIINLVVRAVIFGSNVSKFETELRGATDEFSFDIWAKKGAIGRLHNLATYIRRTDQRRQALRRFQTELAGDDAIFTLEIVVDGKTRWNSIYSMIKRCMTFYSCHLCWTFADSRLTYPSTRAAQRYRALSIPLAKTEK
jgi:hypothetical protein